MMAGLIRIPAVSLLQRIASTSVHHRLAHACSRRRFVSRLSVSEMPSRLSLTLKARPHFSPSTSWSSETRSDFADKRLPSIHPIRATTIALSKRWKTSRRRKTRRAGLFGQIVDSSIRSGQPVWTVGSNSHWYDERPGRCGQQSQLTWSARV